MQHQGATQYVVRRGFVFTKFGGGQVGQVFLKVFIGLGVLIYFFFTMFGFGVGGASPVTTRLLCLVKVFAVFTRRCFLLGRRGVVVTTRVVIGQVRFRG